MKFNLNKKTSRFSRTITRMIQYNISYELRYKTKSSHTDRFISDQRILNLFLWADTIEGSTFWININNLAEELETTGNIIRKRVPYYSFNLRSARSGYSNKSIKVRMLKSKLLRLKRSVYKNQNYEK